MTQVFCGTLAISRLWSGRQLKLKSFLLNPFKNVLNWFSKTIKKIYFSPILIINFRIKSLIWLLSCITLKIDDNFWFLSIPSHQVWSDEFRENKIGQNQFIIFGDNCKDFQIEVKTNLLFIHVITYVTGWENLPWTFISRLLGIYLEVSDLIRLKLQEKSYNFKLCIWTPISLA